MSKITRTASPLDESPMWAITNARGETMRLVRRYSTYYGRTVYVTGTGSSAFEFVTLKDAAEYWEG